MDRLPSLSSNGSRDSRKVGNGTRAHTGQSGLLHLLLWRFRWLDVRFDGGQEIAYKRSCEREVLRSAAFGGAGVAVCLFVYFILTVRNEFGSADNPMRFGMADPRTPQVLVALLAFTWHVSLSGMASWTMCRHPVLRSRGTGERRWDWELLTLLTFSMDGPIMVFTNKGSLAAMYNRRVEDVWALSPPSSDVNALLVVCFTLSLLCSFCPIRCHRMWIAPATSGIAIILAGRFFNFANNAYWPIYMTCLISICQVCTAWQKESERRSNWMYIKDLKAQEGELERRFNIAMRLLSSFCDCVLRLDGDMALLEACPKLAALLLRSPCSAQRGTSVKEFMAFAEFERFITSMNIANDAMSDSSEAAMQLPTSLTLNLLDSMGRPVSVHMYFSSVRRRGVVQHMVGVVEATQKERKEALMEDKSTAWSAMADTTLTDHRSISEPSEHNYQTRLASGMIDSLGDELFLMEHDEDPLSETSSAFNDTLQQVLVEEKISAPKAASAFIRMDDGMEISRANEYFQSLFGTRLPLADADGVVIDGEVVSLGEEPPPPSFADFLEKPAAFRQWLLHCRTELEAGALVPPTSASFGVTSVLPGGTEGPKQMWLSLVVLHGKPPPLATPAGPSSLASVDEAAPAPLRPPEVVAERSSKSIQPPPLQRDWSSAEVMVCLTALSPAPASVRSQQRKATRKRTAEQQAEMDLSFRSILPGVPIPPSSAQEEGAGGVGDIGADLVLPL